VGAADVPALAHAPGVDVTRAQAALTVGFFAASLLVVLATPWCTRDRVTAVADWKSALERNLDVVHAHDIVLVHPPWRDDVVGALRSIALPAGVVVTDAFSPKHGEPWPSVVVIREKNGLALPRALRDRADESTARVDGDLEIVRLRRLEGGDDRSGERSGEQGGDAQIGDDESGVRVRGRDLSDDLAAAIVDVRVPSTTTATPDPSTPASSSPERIACPWDPLKNRHVCAGLPEWMHVGVETLPVDGRDVRCTWSHPKTNATLHVRFPKVHFDAGASLTLDLALTDGAADNTTAAPVFATVSVDDKPLFGAVKAPGKRGFVTKASAVANAPRDADVELVITTPNDGQRHTCFRLVSR
jgi:hypothetical protein